MQYKSRILEKRDIAKDPSRRHPYRVQIFMFVAKKMKSLFKEFLELNATIINL